MIMFIEIYTLTVLSYFAFFYIAIKEGNKQEVKDLIKRDGWIIVTPYLNTLIMMLVLGVIYLSKR